MKPYYRKKVGRHQVHAVDANQEQIVEDLRQSGHSVHILTSVGEGFPDLAVGRGNVTLLCEVKMPGEGLNPKQKEWHDRWKGHKMVATDSITIIEAMNKAVRGKK